MTRLFRLRIGGCGCCAWHETAEIVGEVLMPDGRAILQLKDSDGTQTWWVDPLLDCGYESD